MPWLKQHLQYRNPCSASFLHTLATLPPELDSIPSVSILISTMSSLFLSFPHSIHSIPSVLWVLATPPCWLSLIECWPCHSLCSVQVWWSTHRCLCWYPSFANWWVWLCMLVTVRPKCPTRFVSPKACFLHTATFITLCLLISKATSVPSKVPYCSLNR